MEIQLSYDDLNRDGKYYYSQDRCDKIKFFEHVDKRHHQYYEQASRIVFQRFEKPSIVLKG